MRFSRVNGRIFVTFADDRSGLEQGTLVDGSNYQFGKSVRASRTAGCRTS